MMQYGYTTDGMRVPVEALYTCVQIRCDHFVKGWDVLGPYNKGPGGWDPDSGCENYEKDTGRRYEDLLPV
jgi:hypothetical protein